MARRMNAKGIANNFKEYLLNSDVRDHIAKIVLFGSHAKGEGTSQSDLDILIFTTNGQDIKSRLMDKTFDFMLENNVPIELIIEGIDGLFFRYDYFIRNVTNYGMEIYTMEKDKIKLAMLRSMRGLADEYYDSACEVFDRNRIRLAVDTAYNAAELAAKGLILLKQDDLPGSHGGIVGIFGNLYIKTNEIDKELGRGLNEALRLRNIARYKTDVSPSKEKAEFVLRLAEKLIRIVTAKSGE